MTQIGQPSSEANLTACGELERTGYQNVDNPAPTQLNSFLPDNVECLETIEENPTTTSKTPDEIAVTVSQSKDADCLARELDALKKRYSDLEKQLTLSKRTTEYLKTRGKILEERVADKKQTVIQLNKELTILKEKSEKKHGVNCQSVLRTLRKVFTDSQCKMLIDKNKKTEWDSESIFRALYLRTISKRTYLYLQKNVPYPLPSLVHLKRWASSINLRQGILLDVFTVLKTASQNLSKLGKVVVLQFDVFRVSSIHEYDKKMDEVIGPHQQVVVGLARGLFSKWKQPIYIDFSDNMITKDGLFSLVEKLHEAGFVVVSCTLDLEWASKDVSQNYDISEDKPWFIHPAQPDIRIHFFLEPSNLVKSYSNFLLDNGFLAADGKTISKETFQKLVDIQVIEQPGHCSLSQNSIEMDKLLGSDSILASKLLSHATATAIRKCQGIIGNLEDVQYLADFIERFSSWHNLMNSSTDVASSRNVGYGRFLEEQNKILDQMRSTIVSMNYVESHGMAVLQKGFLISISAVKNLLFDMKKWYGVKYILLRRLSQESVKKFFMDVQKACDSNDYPSPLAIVNHIKAIMLCKCETSLSEDTYLVADALHKAHVCLKREDIAIEEGDIALLELPNSELGETLITGFVNSECASGTMVNYELLEGSEDGQTYVGSWVAKKHAKQWPQLGVNTYELTIDHAYAFPSLIEQLSCGELIAPSQEWLKTVKELEEQFMLQHGKDTIEQGPGVTRNLTQKLVQLFPQIHPDVLKSFVCVRTFIRIRYLNTKQSFVTVLNESGDCEVDNETFDLIEDQRIVLS